MIEYPVHEVLEFEEITEGTSDDPRDNPDVSSDLQPDIWSDEEEQSRYDQIPLTTDSVHDYLRSIARYPLLNAIQEVELSKTMEAGLYAQHKLESEEDIDPVYADELIELARLGREARLTMVASNSRLVVSIAKRYMRSKMEFPDIIQEGNLGLHRAVEKFDYKKGYKFSTYATWWIRQAITRGIADQGRTIRLPVHVVEEVNRVNRIRQTAERLGEVATPEHIAQELGLAPKRVRDLIRYDKDPVSFDLSLEDGGGKTPGSAGNSLGNMIADDQPSPEEHIEVTQMQSALLAGLENLHPRLQFILNHRYGLNGSKLLSLEEVGKRIKLTRERVRQLEKNAIEKLAADESLRDLAAAYFAEE